MSEVCKNILAITTSLSNVCCHAATSLQFSNSAHMYLFDSSKLIYFAGKWQIQLRGLLFRGSCVVRGARRVGTDLAQIGMSEIIYTLHKNRGGCHWKSAFNIDALHSHCDTS